MPDLQTESAVKIVHPYRKIEKRERNRKIGKYRKNKRREKEKRKKQKDIQIQKYKIAQTEKRERKSKIDRKHAQRQQ